MITAKCSKCLSVFLWFFLTDTDLVEPANKENCCPDLSEDCESVAHSSRSSDIMADGNSCDKVEVDTDDNDTDNHPIKVELDCKPSSPKITECTAENSKDTVGVTNWTPGRRTRIKHKRRPVKLKRSKSARVLNKRLSAEAGKADGGLLDTRDKIHKRGRQKRNGSHENKVKDVVTAKAKCDKPIALPKRPLLHICDVCGKAFSNLSKLKVHNYQHSGERPFR